MNPITFEPILKRIRWGGRRLGTTLGKSLGSETDYAESWEICDHHEDQSIVAHGTYAGWSLNRLINQYPQEIFGNDGTKKEFPLLIKYLDCNDRLSVQVHPNDEQAKKYAPNENGKTEAWIIISAEPESVIYAGLKQNVTPEVLRTSIEQGTVKDCLHGITPKAGDCFFIPAGTVHAIGEGVLIAEVQQSSDLTFRLYDWERKDQQGNFRELHVEQAFECINFEKRPIQKESPVVTVKTDNFEEQKLITSDYFDIERVLIRDQYHLQCNSQCKILMILSGQGTIHFSETTEEFSVGKTYLIPASCCDLLLTAKKSTSCDCLIATLP